MALVSSSSSRSHLLNQKRLEDQKGEPEEKKKKKKKVLLAITKSSASRDASCGAEAESNGASESTTDLRPLLPPAASKHTNTRRRHETEVTNAISTFLSGRKRERERSGPQQTFGLQSSNAHERREERERERRRELTSEHTD